MGETAVVVREVTRIFENGEDYLKALNRVTLEIKKGEFVVIMGTSGSGKTTLLNLIGGLDTPTEGFISVDGVSVSELSAEERTVFRREKVGFVFQKFNLLPSVTVLENLLLPLKLLNLEISRGEIEEMAGRLGIGEKLYQMPDRLSGGQQQRAAIARALLHRPGVILADEPTGSLDQKTGVDVIRQMREMCRERGQTLIVVTHDERIRTLADRTLRLEDGEVTEPDENPKKSVEKDGRQDPS